MLSDKFLWEANMSEVALLGSGAFGEVFLVKDKNGKLLVVKRSYKRSDTESVQVEQYNMKGLISEHVVHLHGWYTDNKDSCLYLLMEYCNEGDLADYLAKHFPIPEKTLIGLIAQLLIGLDHIHLRHMIHRDIKLQNIMLHNGGQVRALTAKIGDFGACTKLDATDALAATTVGTPIYLSPEVMNGHSYTRKADIWGLGVVCYKMMTNNFPFSFRGGYCFKFPAEPEIPTHPSLTKGYSTELGDLVLSMLTRSRSQRPTARTLLSSNLFKEFFYEWPCMPLSMVGAVGVFASRPNVVVNIRSAPSVQAKRIKGLQYGDQIYISRTAITSSEQQPWFRVVHPFMGYCVATQDGHNLFQLFQDPQRYAPI